MVGDTRRTRLLALGLVAAVLVLLQGQLRVALDAMRAIEAQVGLALVPSAAILVVVLLLYFQTQRYEQRIQRSVSDTRVSSSAKVLTVPSTRSLRAPTPSASPDGAGARSERVDGTVNTFAELDTLANLLD